ncbi:MAG: MG2 domain-containing protein [Bacteroidales bacterium]|nr:MG2 domain-containing protein [Bacteroidales bacterium]
MKKIFCFFFVVVFSINTYNQTNIKYNYDKEWKIIDSLLTNGLYKTALNLVEKVYQNADKENNHFQRLKATIKKIDIQKYISDNIETEFFKIISTEINKSSVPYSNIYYSILAGLFANYLSVNYIKIQKFTYSENETDDIRTWSAYRILQTCSQYYKKSLENEDILKKISVTSFNELFTYSKEDIEYFTSLYDLLVYQMLDFYVKFAKYFPAYSESFSINNLSFFKPYFEFINIKIPQFDTISPIYNILWCYQKLLKCHSDNKNIELTILWDLRRLKYIHDNSQLLDKDDLYRESLIKLLADNNTLPISQAIVYAISRFNIEQSASNRSKVKGVLYQTLKLCEEYISRFPNGKFVNNLKNIVYEITKKDLQFEIEKYIVSNEHFPVKIHYRNINKCRIYIGYLTKDIAKGIISQIYDNRVVGLLVKNSKMIYDTIINLPNFNDFLSHSTEVILPPLPYGFYLLALSSDSLFDENTSVQCYNTFNVTDLVCLKTSYNDSVNRVVVLNRKSGLPVKKAAITVYKNFYGTHKLPEKGKTYYTDENGYAFLLTENDNFAKSYDGYFTLEIINGSDTLVPDDNIYPIARQKYYEEQKKQVHIITDRSIYQPGQKVYYKAIVYDNNTKYIVKDFNLKVVFKDPNFQVIETHELVTNEFGSVSGVFEIPRNALNGNYSINTETSSTYIKVEEYKIPKFYINIEKPNKEYALYDTISLKIIAKQYTGIPIQNASVQYEVYLMSRYFYFIKPPFSLKQIKLKDGTTKTDLNGEAYVTFIAIPDSSNIKDNPIFDYIIKVKVTDINNETQFTQTNISISDMPVFFKSTISNIILSSRDDKIKVLTLNNSEKPIITSLLINIYSLINPEFLKPRLWETPDTFLYTKKEWEKLLPFYVYDQKLNIKDLKIEKLVESIKSESKSEHVFNLNLKKSGYYLIEYKTVVNNKEVTHKEYFIYLNPQEKEIRLNHPFLCVTDKSEYFANEKIKLYFYSTIKNYFVAITATTSFKTYFYFLNLKGDNLKSIEIPLENIKAPSENVIINCLCVYNNRIYTEKINISISNPEKILVIKADSIPNKLEPGSNATVKLRITNFNGKPVNGELAISVYDKALDAIHSHTWNFNPYSYYLNEISFSSLTMFQCQNSYVYILPINYFEEKSLYHGNVLIYIPKIFIQSYRESIPRITKSKPKTLTVEAMSETQSPEILKNLDSGIINIDLRKNFSETALFIPSLKPDENGYLEFSFKVPQSLTTWKILTLFHTNDLKILNETFEFITQKNVMLISNLPRYFRKNDSITIPVKVTNNTDININACIKVIINDAFLKVNYSFSKKIDTIIEGKTSASILFPFVVPDSLSLLKVTLLMNSNVGSDGEEHLVPIFPDVMSVMEANPFYVDAKQTINLENRNLKNKIKKVDKIIFEYTQNPIWYAIMAIPYVSSIVAENSDEIFNKLYIASLSKYLIENINSFKQVVSKWEKDTITKSLLSELEKNQELKEVILKETPWVNESISEKEVKTNLSQYFKQTKINTNIKLLIEKLLALQTSDGGWSWFKGMKSNKYITINIVFNYYRIKDLLKNSQLNAAIQKAIAYLDNEANIFYKEIKNSLTSDVLAKWQPDYYYLLYSYIKSLNKNKALNNECQNYFYEQSKKFWNSYPVYMQALIALSCYNYGEVDMALKIISSIKEKAIYSNEKGIYWKELFNGWRWYENEIENISIIYSAINTINKDQKILDGIVKWLILQKQTQMWKTSKATVNAIYTILNHFNFNINKKFESTIKIGNKVIDVDYFTKEAGTGYFKVLFDKKDIDTSFYKISIINKANSQAWANIYWYYEAKMNEILNYNTTYLSVERKYFKEVKDKTGNKLIEITDTSVVRAGDVIVVKLIFGCDRDMDFVYLKDMWPANIEPIEYISGYKYNYAFAYYSEITQSSYNIYIDRLPKGKHVIEYKIKALTPGLCNTGIAYIQCYYSPSFTSHSEGRLLKVIKNE